MAWQLRALQLIMQTAHYITPMAMSVREERERMEEREEGEREGGEGGGRERGRRRREREREEREETAHSGLHYKAIS